MLCFPRDNVDALCERALYLFRSLSSKNDALLIQITLLSGTAEDEPKSKNIDGQQGTHHIQALLYPGTHGSGTLHLLEGFSDMENAPLSKNVNRTSARPFSMVMMEKSLGAIGAYVDQQKSRHRSSIPYRLEEMPVDVVESFKPPQETTIVVTESK